MAASKLDAGELARQLASLPTLDRESLKARWEELFDARPPIRASQSFMRLGIAYRLQEATLGRLPLRIRRRLDKTADALAAGKPVMAVPVTRIKPGTKLLRDWQGDTHEVLVLEQGLLYRGETYRSLSEIARTITGARWSGPAFFGLKRAT